jgi:hypothetical protein
VFATDDRAQKRTIAKSFNERRTSRLPIVGQNNFGFPFCPRATSEIYVSGTQNGYSLRKKGQNQDSTGNLVEKKYRGFELRYGMIRTRYEPAGRMNPIDCTCRLFFTNDGVMSVCGSHQCHHGQSLISSLSCGAVLLRCCDDARFIRSAGCSCVPTVCSIFVRTHSIPKQPLRGTSVRTGTGTVGYY